MFENTRELIRERIQMIRNNELNLRDRLSMIFVITGFGLSIVAFVSTLLTDYPLLMNIPNVILMIMCLTLPILFEDLTKATRIALYFVGYLYFPFLFFTNGGMNGATPIYFVLIVVYMAFYLKRTELIISVAITLLYYSLIIVFGYNFPDMVMPLQGQAGLFIEILLGVLSTSVVISIIAYTTFNSYSLENKKSVELMKELEKRNIELEELSIRDQLTGVYNRRYFLEVLNNELLHYKKYQQHFYVLMIDLDDFKKVNDTYGHLFGDEVLRRIAKTIDKTTRDYDIVCRYGGEEFCIIISHLNPDEGVVIAERIRLLVEEIKFRNEVKMTISIGMTMNQKNDTPEKIIKRADDRLYVAKSEGKNCVR